MNKDANVPFPRKLYDLIEAEEDWLIEWAPHGECFFIRDVEEFCARVLAKYFRHTKLTSFQRQLNLYGFRRITKGVDTGAYVHPLFARDGPPATVDAIKRVRKGGAPDGRWSAAKQRDACALSGGTRPPGTSPNSPHHFPDHHGGADGRPHSWTGGSGGGGGHFGGRRRSGTSGTSDDDEDDDEGRDEDEDDEYYPSGRRRKPAANIYSKPYFTAGSSSRRNPPRSAAPGIAPGGAANGTAHGAANGGGSASLSEAMDVPGALAASGSRGGRGGRARSGSVGSHSAAAAGASEWVYGGGGSSSSDAVRRAGADVGFAGQRGGSGSAAAEDWPPQGGRSAPAAYTFTDFGLLADVDPFAPVPGAAPAAAAGFGSHPPYCGGGAMRPPLPGSPRAAAPAPRYFSAPAAAAPFFFRSGGGGESPNNGLLPDLPSGLERLAAGGGAFGHSFGPPAQLQRSGSHLSQNLSSGEFGPGSSGGVGGSGDGDALMGSASLQDLAGLDDLDQFTFEASLGFGDGGNGSNPAPPAPPPPLNHPRLLLAGLAAKGSSSSAPAAPQGPGMPEPAAQAPFAMED